MKSLHDIAPEINGEATPERVDKRLADIFADANNQTETGLEWHEDETGKFQRLKGRVLDKETDTVAAVLVLKKYEPTTENELVGKITARPTLTTSYAHYDLWFNQPTGRYEVSKTTDKEIQRAMARKAIGRQPASAHPRVTGEDNIKLAIKYLEHFEPEPSIG
jgi:hypothetical protein